MAAPSRTAAPVRKTTMRPPPPPVRPSQFRGLTPGPHTSNGRISPSDSIVSSRSRSPAQNGTAKRKDREFDNETGEETNINVVVRCRGRSDREVRENSGVVVSTNGVKGDTVDLSMGPNALSNKTYHFDRVFSPAADQGMVFKEVVAPILNEVLAGFNCTIFAYGQTGTGKTYTMSGDIQDTLPIPDDAGIIPRVLHSLFATLEAEDLENAVKCSFIELYNEELRDLLAADETVKLKIFDDASRKSQSATVVQGVEESHIKTAAKGIELLRLGSHKRQVAATKCNDLSSRSHTVFTITIYAKRVSENGEDFVTAGKLNLVDLAGSENIQRSGAENKRAAEAGLINKSLLTLGRVINALVEKNAHIPYRESKLTRLLQDSLGGRTKTCIIATLSPAKSNLEETISTLDYAFRAKNIRNKPQMNQTLSKKTLIREFTAEIEKLKGELIATRQRNGVYLTAENYEDITTESESRRILTEEQRDKLETMEANLKSKTQELFLLTSSFQNLKKDNEMIKSTLAGTKDALEKTEIVLEQARQTLAEETMLRKAHQGTEDNLANIGRDLIATLDKTTTDIGGLHSKLRRRSDLQTLNRTHWRSTQNQVSDATQAVEQRMFEFEAQHKNVIAQLVAKVQSFVKDEFSQVSDSEAFLSEKKTEFDRSEGEINEQTTSSRDGMNAVLEEIKTLRDDVNSKVGQGLQGLSTAAERISAGVIAELETLHTQLHTSYSSLGKEFKITFDDLTKQLRSQQEEAQKLRTQLFQAGGALIKANEDSSRQLANAVAEERRKGAEERASLITQMTSMINAYGEAQDERVDAKINAVQRDIEVSKKVFEEARASYDKSMDAWSTKEDSLVEGVLKSRENVKSRIKKDWTTANEQNSAIQMTTRAVHKETVEIVDAQVEQMDQQLQAMDEILSRVRAQNSTHHETHIRTLATLATTVKQSYESVGHRFGQSSHRLESMAEEIASMTTQVEHVAKHVYDDSVTRLRELRDDIDDTTINEYMPTGETPQKTQYHYVKDLPRTEGHDMLLSNVRKETSTNSNVKPGRSSPTKGLIYEDGSATLSSPTLTKVLARPLSAGGLREVDLNANSAIKFDGNHTIAVSALEVKKISSSNDYTLPPSKRQNTGNEISFSASVGSRGHKKGGIIEGRENIPLSASVGPGGGRVLRRRGS